MPLGTESPSFDQSESNIIAMKLDEDVLRESKLNTFVAFDQPYVNQAPLDILERWREMYSDTIGNITTNNHIYPVLGDLLANDAIKAALRTFVLLRCDIEVKVLTTSSPFHYGNIFVAHAPMMPVGVSPPPFNMWSWSEDSDSAGPNWVRLINNNSAMLDVSIQNEFVLKMSWPSPVNWISLREFYNGTLGDNVLLFAARAFQVAVFCNHVIGKLNSALADAIPFKIYARMTNVVTQAFTFDNTVAPTGTEVTAQMFNGKTGHLGWTVAGMAIDAAFRQGAQTLYDSFAGLNLREDPTSAAQSAEIKACDVPDNTLKQVPDMYGDLVFNRSPQRTLVPYEVVGPRHNKILDYIREPCFLSVHDIHEIDSRVVTFNAWPTAEPDLGNAGGYHDKMSFLSQYFRFWRGSIVFSFCFFSSPFLSAKIRIVVEWKQTVNPKYQEEMTRIVSLRGSHVETISIPFLYPSPWKTIDSPEALDSGWRDQIPRISVYLMDSIESVGDLQPTIIMQVFKHAGQDFEFDSLRSANNVPQEGLEVQAQMFVSDLAMREESIFDSTMRTPFRKGTISTIEAIAQRYDNMWHYSTFYPLPHCPQAGLQDQPNADSIGAIFLYFRGEMDFLNGFEPPTADTSLAVIHMQHDLITGPHVHASGSVADGTAIVDLHYTSVFETRIPCMSKYDWVPLDFESESVYLASDFAGIFVPELTSNEPLIAQFKKLSSNSSFLFRIPPPLSFYWASAPVPAPVEQGKPVLQPRSENKLKLPSDTFTVSVKKWKK